jgi:hypothetical protein
MCTENPRGVSDRSSFLRGIFDIFKIIFFSTASYATSQIHLCRWMLGLRRNEDPMKGLRTLYLAKSLCHVISYSPLLLHEGRVIFATAEVEIYSRQTL